MGDEFLEYAINLVKNGNFKRAENILLGLLSQDKKNEDAWWWLHFCVKTDMQKVDCLQKILDINPENKGATLALAWLTAGTIEIQSDQDGEESLISLDKDTALEKLEDIQKTQSDQNHKGPLVSTNKDATSERLMDIQETQPRRNEPERNNKERLDLPDKDYSIKRPANIQATQSGRNQPKQNNEDSFVLPDKNSISKEPHVFNIKIYKSVFPTLGKDIFVSSTKPLADFPEVESAMYGTRLFIGGVSFSPFDYPKCVETEHVHQSQCQTCEFFAKSDCPILNNSSLLHEVKILFALRKRDWQESRDRRDVVIDNIYSELKGHGRPLHYEIVSQIINDRYPKLKLSSWTILKIMTAHPEKFESTDRGVYKAK